MLKSFMAFALIACSTSALIASETKPKTEKVAANTTELKVEGMTCKGCVGKVTVGLESVAGVKMAAVDLKTGVATITLDESGKFDSTKAITAMKNKGFKASLKK
jgi:P-type Cu+ transporter